VAVTGAAASRLRTGHSIAEELIFRGFGTSAATIFSGFPANGFALALGTSWPRSLAAAPDSGPGIPVRSEAPAGNYLFGIPMPPEAGQAMLIALMALGAMALVALLFASELELPARYRSWRTRRVQRS
jgi:hypothetical protein